MTPRRARWTRCLALAAVLAVPLAAAGGGREAEVPRLRLGWSELKAQLGLRGSSFTPRVEVWRLPLAVRGARASSREWAGLVKFWAMGTGFAVGRRGAGYGLAAGAALPLDHGIDLTASYRLTGFAAGAPIGTEVDDVQERSGAPFLGLEFEF